MRIPERLLSHAHLNSAVASATLLAALSFTSPASAFCRTTTCEPDLESCGRDDRGCVTSGVHLRWTRLPIVYRLAARGSTAFERNDARAKIASAFDVWTRAVCSDGRRTSLVVVEGDPIPEDKPLGLKRGPEPFGIYFRDGTWPYPAATTTLAITNQEYGKESGRIIYADIEINTRKTSLVILDLVAVHEAGHYLGLAHSQEPGSIMAAAYDSAGTRGPNDDDLAGVCEMFPPDGLPEETDEGCHVTPSTSPVEARPPWLSFAMVVLFPAILRRFRAHRRHR